MRVVVVVVVVGVRRLFTRPSEFTEFKIRVPNKTERRRLLQDFHGLVVLRWVGVFLGSAAVTLSYARVRVGYLKESGFSL